MKAEKIKAVIEVAKHAGDEHAKDCEILQMAAKVARDIDVEGNAGLATLLEVLASRMGKTNAVLEAIESDLEEAIATS